MADEVKAAREFLRGLGTRERKPWDEPIADSRPAAPARKPAPKPAARPKSTGDAAGEQYDRLAKRNREFAKATRHLREN